MRALAAVTFLCSAAYAHVGAKVSLARFSNPPALLTSPDGGVSAGSLVSADGSFDVTWNDGDMDPTGRYYFYYMDHTPPQGLSTNDIATVATPLPEGAAGIWAACDCVDGNGVLCPDSGVRDCRDDFLWDTHALAPGAYWLIAIDNDPPYYLYSVSESPVRIGHGGTAPPGAMFLRPNGIGSADQSYTVEWVAAGDAPLSFDLAWGPDVEPQVKDPPSLIGTALTATDEGNGKWSYVWDSSQVPSGSIYVQLTVHDAAGRSTVTSSLDLTVFHAGAPRDAGADLAHDLAAPPRKAGGSCQLAAEGAPALPLFVGALVALLFGVVARRRAR